MNIKSSFENEEILFHGLNERKSILKQGRTKVQSGDNLPRGGALQKTVLLGPRKYCSLKNVVYTSLNTVLFCVNM